MGVPSGSLAHSWHTLLVVMADCSLSFPDQRCTDCKLLTDVSRLDVSGLWERHSRRHSTVPAETTPVDDERHRPAGVLFAEIRPRHAAPAPTTLAEGTGANRLQAGCPCLQMPAWISPTVPR